MLRLTRTFTLSVTLFGGCDVDFMNTGGYNVSSQVNQVLKETLIIWGEDDQIIDIKLVVVENLMANRLCQSQVITTVNQAFLLFIGMECSKD
nr:alpha/beta hydrolase fold-1 [Tanacetum cinerariifolium]